MSAIPGVAPLELLPKRLEIADFTAHELELVLGESADRELSKDNYNWIGAFLVEQVGVHEAEVSEWFKCGAESLDGKRPLDIWGEIEGFAATFDYAKAFKRAVDESLDPDETGDPWTDNLNRSYGIAQSALVMIDRAFQLVGGREGEITFLADSRTPDQCQLDWRGNSRFDQHRLTQRDGELERTYFVIRYLAGAQPTIFRSGILEYYQGEFLETDSDSDFDGRAPSAGEVASLIVPLASQIKAGSLVRMGK